ncbi:hypothetical protein Pve01_68240 [Planomonospora venezuelensis]|nr:hypothetical protein Pve01_68240 [Planomonospora venezuelensis]
MFKDDDLIRVVAREGILIAAGGAASLLQTAHPKVAQGVYDHSYTAEDPLGRLRGTMQWVYAVSWGTREEAERLSAVVTRMHDQVTGPDYRANDPELQVWVAATLFATGVHIYEALFRKLDAAELTAYYEQSKVFATILGCPPELVPATYEDFRVYYADMLATLKISDASRAVAEQVLNPDLPWYMRPGLPTIRLITAGLMPAPIREQYGWHWSPARQARFTVLMRALAVVYPRLPMRLRTLPRDYYLSELRKRMSSRGGTLRRAA